ncbi:MAG: Lrp/AsnC family transcriptional regulator [Pseudomonadota bacterium]
MGMRPSSDLNPTGSSERMLPQKQNKRGLKLADRAECVHSLDPDPAEFGDTMHNTDDLDLRILRAMQSDGSLSVSQIAEQVGLSQSPCSRRISRLQEAGYIRGKSVELDRRRLGFNAVVVARVKLDKHDKQALDAFKSEIRAIPEIQYAVLLMGAFDYDLHIVVRDIDHYQTLMHQRLVSLPGVKEMESSVVLDVVKKSNALPI